MWQLRGKRRREGGDADGKGAQSALLPTTLGGRQRRLRRGRGLRCLCCQCFGLSGKTAWWGLSQEAASVTPWRAEKGPEVGKEPATA